MKEIIEEDNDWIYYKKEINGKLKLVGMKTKHVGRPSTIEELIAIEEKRKTKAENYWKFKRSW